MNSDTLTRTGPRDLPARPHHITPTGLLRSEWTKLWSLRSSWATLVLSAAGSLALGLVVSSSYEPGGGNTSGDDAIDFVGFGFQMSSVLVALLGVLCATGEYASGSVRSTFAAVPRRTPVLLAKASVLAATVFALYLPLVLGTYLLSSALLSGTDLETSLTDPGVIRSLLSLVVFVAYASLLGLVLGVLLRRGAGAIGTYVGIALILPDLVALLPWSWTDTAVAALPHNAPAPLLVTQADPGSFTPLVCVLLMAGWTLLGLVCATYRLRSRDV